MKKTNEVKEKIETKKIKNVIEKEEIIKFISKEDVEEFKNIATGRKFCKIGERIKDICLEEIKRYEYENTKNVIIKLFKHRKFRKNKEKLMIENRTASLIRALAKSILNAETKEKQEDDTKVQNLENSVINVENLEIKVKEKILEKIDNYNNTAK